MDAAIRITLQSKTGENNRNREAVSKETCFSSSRRYYQRTIQVEEKNCPKLHTVTVQQCPRCTQAGW